MYSTAEELQEKIDEYFAGGYRTIKRIVNDRVIELPDITISDLVIFLGFCDRQSFYEYEQKPEFAYTIKRSRSFIEREYESLLRLGNCTGAIFALKNFGWKDKTEFSHGLNESSLAVLLAALPEEYAEAVKAALVRK